MGSLRYWPFVGALVIVSALMVVTVNYAQLMAGGAVGLAGIVGRVFAAAILPALIAIWSFREPRDRAPRLPSVVLAVIGASLVADRWATVARMNGDYRTPESSALMLAFSVGAGVLVFTGVCILAGLFRSRTKAA